MHKTLLRCLLFFSLLSGCGQGAGDTKSSSGNDTERPNFLLIVVDDMAFADLGSFGGEIETPYLDQLANEGIRFTNFHGAPMCSPSRAMLMTGVDAHPAGFGNMLEELSPNQKDQPGYEGYLNKRVVTVASLLSGAGYRTFMAGKWHLGSNTTANPAFRGFERSFALGSGGASHFSDMRPAYAPSPDIKANYWEDGEKLTSLPESFEYSSEFYVDRMIEYLSETEKHDDPFFAYLSFTAPHWPLQAPDEAIARQAGRYDDGYDALAAQRLARLKEMGLLGAQTKLSGRSPKELPWNELSDEQRRVEIRAMEVYAAMIAEVDRHTGRLLDYMRASGLDKNTVVIFLSDNGAEGHDLDETWPMEAFPDIRKTIDTTHDFSYENIGRPGSYTLYGPNWANAGAPAFRLHKGFPTEGGTRVAAFVSYPEKIASPAIVDEFVSIADVTPTVLELAGIEHPGTSYAGRPVEAMIGRSFAPVLNGEPVTDPGRPMGLELMGKRTIRAGDWKLVHMPEPYGDDDWQLFNLKEDVGESMDVAADHPEKVKELKLLWESYAQSNQVIIPDWVSGY